jgi:hypothetical protein
LIACLERIRNMDLDTAAFSYAVAGFAVLPLVPRGKQPVTGFRGYRDATSDLDLVEKARDRWPAANIGGVPGSVGLLVVDVDGPMGREHATPLGLYSEPTLTCISGRPDGGEHRYFLHPDHDRPIGNVRLAPGVDVRADRGYVVLPPSVHASGVVYAWDSACETPAVLPPAVWAMCCLDPVGSARPEHGRWRGATSVGRVRYIPAGQRNDTLFRLACGWRAGGLTEGQILIRLRVENTASCRPPLGDAELSRIAGSAAGYLAGQRRAQDRRPSGCSL